MGGLGNMQDDAGVNRWGSRVMARKTTKERERLH